MEIHFLQPNERLILQTSVKDYVRHIVNSEMFWQDLFRNVQITNLISQELNNNVPRYVADHVPRQVKNYLDIQLESLVLKGVLHQLPSVVANNYQMQQILRDHATQMKTYLQSVAREEVDKIVNEDKYHIINARYFAALDARGRERLNKFEGDGNDLMRKLQNKYDSDFKQLQSELSHLSELKREIENLNNQIWWLKVAIGVLTIGGMITIFSK